MVATTALGCALVAGVPLPAAVDAYRLEFDFEGAPFAIHVSADGALTQPCDERLPRLGAGTLPLARAAADADGDGLPDADDACPWIAAAGDGAGCPISSQSDRDGDGIADSGDRCPQQAGAAAAEGCALLLDRDGDGLPDNRDICPDDHGILRADFAMGCPADGSGHSSARRGADATCHISGGSLPLHAQPSANSAIRELLVPALALPEYSAVLARAAGGWYQLSGGWARASTLRGACYNIPLVNAALGAATGCFLRASGDYANVRVSPAGAVVTRLSAPASQPVLGMSADSAWLFYREGWVSRSVLELSGSCQRLPILDPAQVGSGSVHFCPPGYIGFLRPRISIGKANARVASATLANRLRAAPALNAERIGEIPPRAPLDAVLDGPACSQGFVWWQVQAGAASGWTVESDANANHYYLEPIGAAPAEDLWRRPLAEEPRLAAQRPWHGGNLQALDTARVLALESPRAVAFSPAGRWLAALSGGGEVALFHPPSFAAAGPPYTLADGERISAFAFSPDERWLALGAADGTIVVLPLAAYGSAGTSQNVGSLASAVTALAWSPAGTALAATSGDEALKPARYAGELKLWTLMPAGGPHTAAEFHYSFPYPLTALAFSADGAWLAAAGNADFPQRAALWVYASADGGLRHSKALIASAEPPLLSAAPSADLGDFVYSSGDSLYQLSLPGGEALRFAHHGGKGLAALAFHPRALAGAEALYALLLRAPAGAPTLHIGNALSAYAPALTLEAAAAALAFSADGLYLAIAQPAEDRVLILGVIDA